MGVEDHLNWEKNTPTIGWIKRYKTRPDWFGRGCHTFAQVRNKINEGWPYGAKTIRRRADEIIKPYRAQIKRRKRVLRRIDQGDELSVQKVLVGNLDSAWSRKELHPKIQRVRKAEIFVQPSGLAYVSQSELFYQCVSALALALYLNKKRVQTKIVAVSYAVDVTGDYSKNVDVLTLVKLKSFAKKLNVERLAIQTWAGVFRTYYFFARCCLPFIVGTGLGKTSDVSYKRSILPINKQKDVKRYVVPRTTNETSVKRYIDDLISRGEL